ncbi:hypothetical protein AC140_36810 [Bacteroides fragilis]|nr:hypothetical protein AC140_36810 [Bacteroides fragilis]
MVNTGIAFFESWKEGDKIHVDDNSICCYLFEFFQFFVALSWA